MMQSNWSKIALVFFILALWACSKQKYICPAYQSYYIHDDKFREKLFSYFDTDSSGGGSSENGDQPLVEEEKKEDNAVVPTDSLGNPVASQETHAAKGPPKVIEVKFDKQGLVEGGMKAPIKPVIRQVGKPLKKNYDPRKYSKLDKLPRVYVPLKPDADFKDTLQTMKSDSI